MATYADPGFKANADFLSDLYKRNKLANCRDLEGYFTGSGGRDTLNIAYNQANSIVNYFLSRYNFWHMKNILTDLKTGMKIDDAFKKEISVDTTDLFLQWEESNFKK